MRFTVDFQARSSSSSSSAARVRAVSSASEIFQNLYNFCIKVADSSLEYASLLPVAAGDLMPDDEDELDHKSGAQHLDDDEFLPSESQQTRSLTKLEDDDEDEFTASLMAAAARGTNFKFWPDFC